MLVTYDPLPSHSVSQLSTERWAHGPQCSVCLAPLAAVSFDPGNQVTFCLQLLSSHTHTHKWTYTCFDNRYLRSCSYRKHWWPNIFVDVCKPVLSLNLAKSATLCSFVRSEETDKAATCTRHLLGNKRKRQTNRTTCGSIPTMKRHSFQLNIKQIESNKSQEYPRTATIGHDHKWPQMTYTTC